MFVYRCVQPGGIIYTFYMHTQSQHMVMYDVAGELATAATAELGEKKIRFIVHGNFNELWF